MMIDPEILRGFFHIAYFVIAAVILLLLVLMVFASWLDRRELRERRKRLEWLRGEPEREPWRAPWGGDGE